MSADTFTRRARLGATVLMCVVGIALIHYLYRVLPRTYRFCFGEPERWENLWLVDGDAVITDGMRLSYFVFWIVMIGFSVAAYLAGLHLLNRCRQGKFFDAETAQSLRRVGGLLLCAMAIDVLFQNTEYWILTWGNSEKLADWWFNYDPSDFKTLTLATILFLFGWVMHPAIAVEQESREYV